MGSIKIPYYSVRRGRGYWLATPRMQALGFPSSVPCGVDGPLAWKVAQEWNTRWQAVRLGREAPPRHVWPSGSLGEAFERFRRSQTWAEKKPRTREDWDRGWRYIEPVFADVAPHTVTFEHADGWYHSLRLTAGDGEAFRAVKIWRALWQVAAAMHYCDGDHDPTFAIRRVTPKSRSATWSEGEVVRLIKGAWRRGYPGLACIIAVAYDTSLSPVDTRSLTFAQSRRDGHRTWFEVERATGRAAVGTLSARSVALMEAYLASLPADLLPTAPIFRNRSGTPYTKNSLAEDFRDIRRAVFPGDSRKLMDMRRSGAVEAMAGDVGVGPLSAKMANTISDAKALQRTYLPVDQSAVGLADEARRRGRRRILENRMGTKVETLLPGELKPASNGDAK